MTLRPATASGRAYPSSDAKATRTNLPDMQSPPHVRAIWLNPADRKKVIEFLYGLGRAKET